MKLTNKQLKNSLYEHKNPKESDNLARFFKTGKGQYGEGDLFLGIKVPIIRKIVRAFSEIDLKELSPSLKSKYHEERLLGFLILVHKYQKSKTLEDRKRIYDFYIKHLRFINNWDLVDLTTPNIIGHYLETAEQKTILMKWAKSDILWEKRIAIMATFYDIRKREKFKMTLKIAKILLHDEHDLIHKAVGWMLREIGNKNIEVEEQFLKKHYKTMPRTMLRYAIEKFPEKKRLRYLKGTM